MAKETTLIAPVGGWNARDALANMKPEEAVILENWFPDTDGVAQRMGSSNHVTGFGSAVESVMVYETTTATTIFVASGASIYNATNATSSPTSVVTSLSNARFQHINFKTSGGQYLYAVNGADAAQLWDGSTWVSVNSGASVSTTGIDTSSFINIFVTSRRVGFIEKQSMSWWYLPAGAVGGTLTEFDLGDVFGDGGYLMAAGSWTLDAGDGLDDYTVFVTSKGQVAVYQGTDPSSANTWAKIGTYKLAPPIGRRCLVKYKGDLILITRDGFIPMSRLVSGRAEEAAISFKIRGAVQDAVQSYASNYGWEGIYYADGPALIFNIPIAETSGQVQYVMNTTTGAWCKFSGWEAICFGVAGNTLYYGTSNSLVKAWTGHADNGTNIQSDCLQAFNYYGARGRVKRFTMARPLITATGVPAIKLNMNVDYNDAIPSSLLSFTASTAGTWDSGTWDSAVWGGEKFNVNKWYTLGGVGTAGGLRMSAVSNGIEVVWIATDITYEVGGVL